MRADGVVRFEDGPFVDRHRQRRHHVTFDVGDGARCRLTDGQQLPNEQLLDVMQHRRLDAEAFVNALEDLKGSTQTVLEQK